MVRNNTCKCMPTLCRKMHMDSCMRAYSTVQQLLCHGGYCELILSLAQTSCRLLFTARTTARSLAALRDVVRSRNPYKSTLAHDAVATAVLHKHHPIIRVGAGLIQFVYRSHLHLATEATRNRNAFLPFFPRVLPVSSKNFRIFFNVFPGSWNCHWYYVSVLVMFNSRDFEVCIPVHIAAGVIGQLSQTFRFIM